MEYDALLDADFKDLVAISAYPIELMSCLFGTSETIVNKGSYGIEKMLNR